MQNWDSTGNPTIKQDDRVCVCLSTGAREKDYKGGGGLKIFTTISSYRRNVRLCEILLIIAEKSEMPIIFTTAIAAVAAVAPKSHSKVFLAWWT